MSFSFRPRYVEEVEIDFGRPVAREAIIETLERLEWRYDHPHPDSFSARVPIGLLSWGEVVTIEFSEDGNVIVESACRAFATLYDWGKNRRNVDHFLQVFLARAQRIAAIRTFADKQDFDTSDSTPLERAISEEKS